MVTENGRRKIAKIIIDVVCVLQSIINECCGFASFAVAPGWELPLKPGRGRDRLEMGVSILWRIIYTSLCYVSELNGFVRIELLNSTISSRWWEYWIVDIIHCYDNILIELEGNRIYQCFNL